MYDVKYIVDENGNRTNAVIPYSDYLEMLEEIEDLKTIAERKDEDTISHNEVKDMLDL
jgi:hypothetical protein